MKKPCHPLPAGPPVPAKRISCFLLVVATSLTPVAAGATDTAEHGATALVARPAPANAKGGYLRALGPAPLRILSPDLQTPPVQLPPLAMFEPPPTPEPAVAVTNQSAGLLAATPPTAPADDTPFYGPPAPDAYGQPPPDPTLAMPSADGIITPQMLVQFFKPVGSNCLGGAWSVPVFVPPSPPTQTRPSTATYRSP